jgi:membrane protein CcdC involved in cytochrome C biogenesis
MSLKAFHIIFVTVTTLFSLFFGMWSLDQYRNVDPSGQNLMFMLLSFAMLVVLPVYGYYFLKKLKDVSFL